MAFVGCGWVQCAPLEGALDRVASLLSDESEAVVLAPGVEGAHEAVNRFVQLVREGTALEVSLAPLAPLALLASMASEAYSQLFLRV